MAISGVCPTAGQFLEATAKIRRIQCRIEDFQAQGRPDSADLESGWLWEARGHLNYLLCEANSVKCTSDDRENLRVTLIQAGLDGLAGKVL